MTWDRTLAEARLRRLHSEVLRGLSLAAVRRAEEIRDESRATHAEIRQRRLADAQRGMRVSPVRRSAARH